MQSGSSARDGEMRNIRARLQAQGTGRGVAMTASTLRHVIALRREGKGGTTRFAQPCLTWGSRQPVEQADGGGVFGEEPTPFFEGARGSRSRGLCGQNHRRRAKAKPTKRRPRPAVRSEWCGQSGPGPYALGRRRQRRQRRSRPLAGRGLRAGPGSCSQRLRAQHPQRPRREDGIGSYRGLPCWGLGRQRTDRPSGIVRSRRGWAHL
jgi:hypothetical protein